MTGRDLEYVVRPELERGPVAHHDLEPARQHDPYVTRLAPFPADMWTHVRGPPPSWLRHNPPHSQVTDVDLLDRDPSELECLVGAHQVLGSNLAHARIFLHGRTHGQRLPEMPLARVRRRYPSLQA